MKVNSELMFYKSKRTPWSDARKVFCFLGHRILGFPATMIGRFLGISLPAVSITSAAVGRIARESKIAINT